MEINYSKKTVHSILRYIGYYLLWGLAFNLLIFVLVWYLSKWDFKQVYYNPYLSPYNGLIVWILIGGIRGWYKRNRKRTMTLRKWASTFLYIAVFGAFMISLQIYYVHKKYPGWYDLPVDSTTCVKKFHSYWLVKDNEYFRRIDECLKTKKLNEGESSVGVAYRSNNISVHKTRLIDYDVITPKLLWILIVFSVITLIKLGGRFGLINFYKGTLSFSNYWYNGISKINFKSFELILLGAVSTIILLALMPKINGFPSKQLPLVLCIASIVLSLRLYFFKTVKIDDHSSKGLPKWFLFITGITVSCVLLMVMGMKAMYYLMVLTGGGFLLLQNRVPPAAVKSIIIVLFVLDPDFLFADDGAWPEGKGFDKFMDDTAGGVGVDGAKEKAGTAVLVVDTALDDDKDQEVTITEPDKKEETDENQDYDNEALDELDFDEDNDMDDDLEGPKINLPLGED
ncbi:hypothetical protein GTQ34_14400 [Muricauda sp. JGD-17]|uniref:Transmembrane protein n=1 Tax=Flagellimonas ochracea TaxID=2696472 RepID=A0A964TFS1_9FLAO|nr:hypothetical protein [Allomuricauda ochracea]NAY93106.1 hypothetical protein [Allomuricauda ochracea]